MASSFKAHGTAAPGNHLSMTMDFFTITTSVNIVPTGTVGDPSQAAFDRLVEIISINGQPIISDMPVSDGNGHYVFKFAIDHTGSWADAATLKAAIISNTPASMGFASDTALAVTVSSSY